MLTASIAHTLAQASMRKLRYLVDALDGALDDGATTEADALASHVATCASHVETQTSDWTRLLEGEALAHNPHADPRTYGAEITTAPEEE